MSERQTPLSECYDANALMRQMLDAGRSLEANPTFADIIAYIDDSQPIVDRVAQLTGKESNEHTVACTILATSAVNAATEAFYKSSNLPEINGQKCSIEIMPPAAIEERSEQMHNAAVNAMDILNKVDYLSLYPEMREKVLEPKRNELRLVLSATEKPEYVPFSERPIIGPDGKPIKPKSIKDILLGMLYTIIIGFIYLIIILIIVVILL